MYIAQTNLIFLKACTRLEDKGIQRVNILQVKCNLKVQLVKVKLQFQGLIQQESKEQEFKDSRALAKVLKPAWLKATKEDMLLVNQDLDRDLKVEWDLVILNQALRAPPYRNISIQVLLHLE